MFVDKAEITVKAGDGGKGCCSFRREAFLPKGGPDGGDGGDGGNVVFVADPGEHTLMDFVFSRHFEAAKGGDGKSKDMHGRNGADLYIKVPAGTIITDLDTGEILADVDNLGEKFIIARGGTGGKGNSRFASSVNRAPREHEPGGKVEALHLGLELKMIADIGFVGFPNAGKSTLMTAISNAKPKIAPYPFTTLHPVIGVVEYPDYSTILAADIPGLLDGAHANVGLGHDFLRHIERTKLLIYVIDVSETDGRDCAEDFATLKNELELYMKGLSKRAGIVVANKIDLPGSAENIKKLKKVLPRALKLVPMSAKGDKDFSPFKLLIREELSKRAETFGRLKEVKRKRLK